MAATGSMYNTAKRPVSEISFRIARMNDMYPYLYCNFGLIELRDRRIVAVLLACIHGPLSHGIVLRLSDFVSA